VEDMLENKREFLNKLLKKVSNKGFTLIELLVSSAIALSIMIILALSISKMTFIMRKLSYKYYVSSTSKNILNKLANDIIRNSNFKSPKDSIFKLSTNEIGFTTNIISNQGLRTVTNKFIYLEIDRILIKDRGISKDYLFKAEKVIYNDENNSGVIDTENEINNRHIDIINLGIVENVINSELYFERKVVNLVRVSIKTDFLFRNQRSRIIYYLDIPISGK
jgi:prepilin-type N-terminal cleavage/methylation domain-containing protein